MTIDNGHGEQVSSPATVLNEVTASVSGAVVQIGTLHGSVHVRSERERAIPRQLPPAPYRFTGRTDELTKITAAVDNADNTGATIVAIGGLGGIGKTCLALHWAHFNAQRFPDGHLFVDLRGFSPNGDPTRPAAVLRGFLDALGIPPAEIPVDLDALAGQYRSLVADRRMLIVLDNARDTSQVAMLLPTSPDCVVLVTSRHYLSELATRHGAQSVDVDVLPDAQARQLLGSHLGTARLAAEPGVVTELVECCAGLPLALGIVAARALRHPGFPLAVLAEELRDHATRLDGLQADEIPMNLRAVFSWSLQSLTSDAITLFRLLGLTPGPEIGLQAALSLAGTPQARTSLRELESAHLITQPVAGRYRLHDLIRIYATEQVKHHAADPPDDALRRLVDFYLHTAFSGERLLDPARVPIHLVPPVPGCRPQPLRDQTEAMAWFVAEYRYLLAAQRLAEHRGWHGTVWQLAWAMDTFHWRRGLVHDQLAVWRAGLMASDRENDRDGQLRAHRRLGYAYSRVGKHRKAVEHLEHALTMAEQAGDRISQAQTHRALTVTWGRQSNDLRALKHAISALQLFEDLDDPVGRADMLNSAGWHSIHLGQYLEARRYCEKALVLHRQHHSRQGEAYTLSSLACLAHSTGDHLEALGRYRQALALFREIGHMYQEANVLEQLGRIHVTLGNHQEARGVWHHARLLCQQQNRTTDADRIQRHLDQLNGPG
ncbi:tetratricopeptide (TPR) repeat protein [Kibdelosporangium banguiense]|uniref:Tetratricopeptide (TPR) repeat protein n=1 Tax=Kibdelosporangium banguiense TaxID=1365924 RepID=A0ABS4TV59_9PSEU|nr:tetratricopeptide repeat protein [Kibdelosporangium banguiense]MBP2328294.1 tetratricopeptide (TPR) repeat protein [Kibdelosporangium banguiense]